MYENDKRAIGMNDLFEYLKHANIDYIWEPERNNILISRGVVSFFHFKEIIKLGYAIYYGSGKIKIYNLTNKNF